MFFDVKSVRFAIDIPSGHLIPRKRIFVMLLRRSLLMPREEVLRSIARLAERNDFGVRRWVELAEDVFDVSLQALERVFEARRIAEAGIKLRQVLDQWMDYCKSIGGLGLG